MNSSNKIVRKSTNIEFIV